MGGHLGGFLILIFIFAVFIGLSASSWCAGIAAFIGGALILAMIALAKVDIVNAIREGKK